MIFPPKNHLISIDEKNFLDIEREHDIQEENLVAPDDSLLLLLLVQPPRPLVLHVFVVKAVPAGVFREELFNGRRQVVLQDPELDLRLCGPLDAQHHDLQQALVQVAGCEAENVDDVISRVFGCGRARAGSEGGPDRSPQSLVLLALVGFKQIFVSLLGLLGNLQFDDFALELKESKLT